MAPQNIGKYQILGKIGQGAMGEVYKARDPVLNRLVAVKTISAILVGDELFRKRFQREAQSAAQLNHPNIITIYDFDETPAGVYMAMELLDGMDLREAIIHRSLPSLKEKLQLFEQVCDGLAFAHASGVIHRDLKPGNIHILSSGAAKILDFGLARPRSSDMTATGTIMGTPHYMSPEQVRGEKADTRSDVFSLGGVFYEVLVGGKPFDASSMHSILFQVLESEAAPLGQRGVPGPLADFVHMALAKDPERRYADAGRMREALRTVRQKLSGSDLDITLVLGASADATIVETPATPGTSPGLSFPPPSAGRGRSLVTGATALDPDERLASDLSRTPQPEPPILPRASRKATADTPRSYAPLLVAAAVTAIALVAGGLYLKTRGRASDAVAPSDVSTEQVGALTEALVSGQVELAQVALENKDYEAASQRAEQALKVDPQNASALQIRDQAEKRLEELNAAVAEARGALEAGDSDRASRALGVVLSIDPRHPAVGQLSAALNRHFLSQAEGARRAAKESRAAADLARASAAEGFPEAAKLVTDAETLFRRQEYAVATQKFLESRDGFERARRAAEAAARVPSPRAVASGGVPTPAQATSQSLPPPTVTTPAPPPPSIAAPATTAPGAPARTAPTQGPDAPVRQLIADYGRAIETQNLDLFKTVKPNLSADEEKRLREAFKSIKSQQVGIAIQAIDVDGSNATVQVTRQDTVNGHAMKAMAQTFRLTRGAGGAWTIQSIGQ